MDLIQQQAKVRPSREVRKEEEDNLNMFIPEIQILEKIVRPLIVYFFLLITFRIVGKRELGR